MPAFNFPDSPTVGQLVTTPNGVTYQWNGTYWVVQSAIQTDLLDDIYVNQDGDTMTGSLDIRQLSSGIYFDRGSTGDGRLARIFAILNEGDGDLTISLRDNSKTLISRLLQATVDADGTESITIRVNDAASLGASDTIVGVFKRYNDTAIDPADISAKQIINRELGDSQYLQLAGGTMTGRITLSGDPIDDLHAATRQYVDAKVATVEGNSIPTDYAETWRITRIVNSGTGTLFVSSSTNSTTRFTTVAITGNISNFPNSGVVSVIQNGTLINTAGAGYSIPADTWYLEVVTTNYYQEDPADSAP